jgi:hypothetical protein
MCLVLLKSTLEDLLCLFLCPSPTRGWHSGRVVAVCYFTFPVKNKMNKSSCKVYHPYILHCILLFDAVNFQIKGIDLLLEGLAPFSQRHFGRTDRNVRDTFLANYVLTEMSVIEPEIDAKEMKVESLMHSDVKNADGVLLTENADAEPKNTSEDLKALSKKRKSKKSKDSSSKKAKSVAYTKVEAIS